jgi:hypothetical protein
MASRKPSIWDEYERGASPDRGGSIYSVGGVSTPFGTGSVVDHSPEEQDDEEQPQLRRRRQVLQGFLYYIFTG